MEVKGKAPNHKTRASQSGRKNTAEADRRKGQARFPRADTRVA